MDYSKDDEAVEKFMIFNLMEQQKEIQKRLEVETATLKQQVEVAETCLNYLADWHDTPGDVNGKLSYGHFDEPCSAKTSREALAKIKSLKEPPKKKTVRVDPYSLVCQLAKMGCSVSGLPCGFKFLEIEIDDETT